MTDLILRLIEGGALLILSGWMARLQSRSAKLADIELEVARIKERETARGEALEQLRDAVTDVQQHMLRRQDVELIRAAMRP